MSEAKKILKSAIEQKRKILTVQESKKILIQEGFPVNPTGFGHSLEEVVSEATKIGFPIVLKVSSEDIIHKSDIGGVVTGIRTIEELKQDFTSMQKKIKTIQQHNTTPIHYPSPMVRYRLHIVIGRQINSTS